MGDWRQYVTLGPSPEHIRRLRKEGIDPKRGELPPHLRQKLEQVFSEIASTPEGMAVIRMAASRGKDGKINVVYNPGGITIAGDGNDIFIGTKDSGMRYVGKDGQLHDMTLQRVVFHEMAHHVRGHTGLGNAKNESEAVRDTNAYMKKYYGEVPRIEDTVRGTRLKGGTPQWDMSVKKRASFDGLVDPKQFANLDGANINRLAALDASPSPHGGAKPDTSLART